MVSSSKGVEVMVCGSDHSGSQPFNYTTLSLGSVSRPPLLFSPLSVTLASEVVSGRLELYLNSSITKLTCDVGNCRAIANDYDSFAEALCGDVVPGMDLYWTILLVTLAVSVLLLVLMLLVASRFVSLEMQKSNRKKPKFYLDGAVVRQVRGTLWQLISVAVYLWWVVYVNQDEVVGQGFCREGEAGCCKQCVWAFGCVFLVASVAVGGVSRTYQYFTIYMIKSMHINIIHVHVYTCA